MTKFVRAVDGKLLNLDTISTCHVATGHQSIQDGGDGTNKAMIFADSHLLGAAGPGGDNQKLMEELVKTVAGCPEGGLWALKDGNVVRL